ncbi:transcriptional repressor [Candidatus Woesearchaeota archaeon CG_4_10_14_0_8_um_filter_47_5]|nr:MAG: transcriptional repressor [Candidatus Woesearchaeota archaeon CG_4_10_14_0_8_um_filter_47_5]
MTSSPDKSAKKTRMTNQRIKILNYLKNVKTHPTAEKVYRAVSQELPQITLATVYRNLNMLADQGEILRMEINNEYHYDAQQGFHQHLVCTKCGKIEDLFVDEISRCVTCNINKKNFLVETVDIIIKGRCKECA